MRHAEQDVLGVAAAARPAGRGKAVSVASVAVVVDAQGAVCCSTATDHVRVGGRSDDRSECARAREISVSVRVFWEIELALAALET